MRDFSIYSIIILVFLLLIGIVTLISHYLRKCIVTNSLDKLYEKIHNDIKWAVTPYFLEISVDAKEITNLAIEIWRLEQRLLDLSSSITENQQKVLENSIEKINRYIEKYDIEIVDYNNVKYNEGLNLEILGIEKDSLVNEPRIKKTIEPTVMIKGKVVRIAKVILIIND